MAITQVVLDTNFLLIPYQFKVDIFSQIDRILTVKYEFFVLDKTIDELKKIITEQKGKDRDAARIALKLISIKNIKAIKTRSGVRTDDAILELPPKGNFIVATQDKDLKRRLINQGTAVIILRQKKKIEIVNYKGFA